MLTISRFEFKAWGSGTNIVSTKRWNKDLPKDEASARQILMSIRLLIGSLEYHMDPTISGYLKAQKERVGTMFGKLDTLMASERRTVNGVQYDAWQPQGLETQWNSFMNYQYILADSKTTKVGKTWLPQLQKVWATQAIRDGSKELPNDTDDQKKAKKISRDLIDDIDAMATKINTMGKWTNPF